MRIVKIDGIGNVAVPDSVRDEEVHQAAGRAKKEPEDTSHWVHIRLSDG